MPTAPRRSTSSLGWRLDADFAFDNGFRVVQFTPPGSGARSSSAPRSPRPRPARPRACTWSSPTSRPHATSSPAAASRSARCSIPATPGAQFQPGRRSGRVSGPAADHASYGSFATFSDPDGNGWLLQEVTTRLPGRVDPAATTFGSTGDLANAMRRAAAAHGEHEQRTGGERRRELARLVRRLHGGGAGRDGAADVSGTTRLGRSCHEHLADRVDQAAVPDDRRT